MIGILKVIFKKERPPLEVINSHLKIFKGNLKAWELEGDFSCPREKHWNLNVKVFEQQDYLNRLLNAEYHTNIFDFKLEPHSTMDDDFSHLSITGNNLKSELILLNIPYKKIKTLKKNYKKHTYIIKDKSINIGNIKVYTKKAIIDNKEIYVLKGNENGI